MSEFRKLALAYVGLLVLLALTVGSSFIPLGGLNASVNMAVGMAKAAVIAVAFMHIVRAEALVHLVAIAVATWLLILAGLTLIS
ncbi:hypothetical protein [Mesorhizobium sp. SP-1A]|uniref:hypothetical protein n=1 Tax=Mesorhizobium sp. SP-1A TaxID=3077840 RepID=UPI0028F6D49C|nr:hypothetical protein [Mesorhizobium sp. SP-1A]